MMKITKNMKYMLVGLFIAVIIGIYFFTRRKNISTYKFPDNTPPTSITTLYNKYNQLLLSCSDAFLISNDQAAYNNCLTSNVNFFSSNACPAAITNGGSRTVTNLTQCNALTSTDKVCPTATEWDGSNAAYTGDETAIKNAYVDMISRAGTAVTASISFPASGVITAARKADVRAATNRYLSNLCPAFYRTTSSNTVTKVDTSYDTTDYFRAYRTNDTSVNYYLDDAARLNGSTDALRQTAATNLTAWAKNAGDSASELALPNGPIVANFPNTRYNAITAGYNGSAVDNEGQPCSIPNWVMAHNFGPGTLIKQGTLLNGSGANKLPITWATSASATKTCYYTPPTSGVVHMD